VLVWTLFDFANTSFSVLIVAVGYSLYFKQVVAGGAGRGDFLWGTAVSISMLVTALLAPALGAASDFAHSRKRFLFAFTAASIAATALLWFVDAGMVLTGMALFVVANVGFEGGIVFYNAFLPLLASPRSYGRVSGYGFAMGYVGSLVSLLIAFPLFEGGFAPANLQNVRLSFLIAAGMFLVFSLPLFLFLPDVPRTEGADRNYFRAGFRRVIDTVTHVRSYRNVARFLLAFFLYNDGILTVISFASIFAQGSLGFTLVEVLVLFAVVQASGIVGSILIGFLSDRIGPKRSIVITLLAWLVVVAAAFFVTSKNVFFAVGMIAGAAMGGSQSASRSLMASLTPPEREAEFFGFYDGFCGKASAVIGTFLFGVLSLAMSQRAAVVSVGVFFLAGLWLLRSVEDPFDRRAGA
jgi:UMF1 family MFS transporter